jgi:hypothetical protein
MAAAANGSSCCPNSTGFRFICCKHACAKTSDLSHTQLVLVGAFIFCFKTNAMLHALCIKCNAHVAVVTLTPPSYMGFNITSLRNIEVRVGSTLPSSTRLPSSINSNCGNTASIKPGKTTMLCSGGKKALWYPSRSGGHVTCFTETEAASFGLKFLGARRS